MRPSFAFRRAVAALALAFTVQQVLWCFPVQAWANPAGGKVVAGQAAVQQQGSTLTVTQGTPRAIVNWQGFSIGAGETTRFVQPSATSAILNRVLGFGPSRLDGSLTATGQVFLINPNGVVIGPTGRIETGGGFVASTLHVPDAAFLAGGDLDFAGDALAGIRNLGTITATTGDVILAARTVENAGTLRAPQGAVGLAAGNEVLYRPAGAARLFVKSALALPEQTDGVTHTGLIAAAQAELRAAGGNVYALAVNTGGAIHATGVSERDGRVLLTSAGGAITTAGVITARRSTGDGGEIRLQAEGGGPATISVGGTLDAAGAAPGAKGGEITATGETATLTDTARLDVSGDAGGGLVRIGGDYQGKNPDVHNAAMTTVAPGAEIRADALTRGDGGRVIVWAEDATRFLGRIWARGGSLFGDGGFAEISGHRLSYDGLTDLRAPHGRWGTLLLDPFEWVISDKYDDGGGAVSYRNTDKLSDDLELGNVELMAGPVAEDGCGIRFESGVVEWASGSTLSLLVRPQAGYDGAGIAMGMNPAVDQRVAPRISATNGGRLVLEPWYRLLASSDTEISLAGAGASLTLTPVVHARDRVGTFSLPGKIVTPLLTLLDGHATGCSGANCRLVMDNPANDIREIVIGDGAGPFPSPFGTVQALPSLSLFSTTSTSVETKGWVQFEGDVTIRTAGDLTLKSFLGFDPALSGETAVLSAGGRFLNVGTPLSRPRGAGIPDLVSQLPYVSRMLVLSADPRNDNDGANTSTWLPGVPGDPTMQGRIYAKSYADLPSLPAGSWFVHSLAPTATLKPGSGSKTYGEANPTGLWTMSGVVLGPASGRILPDTFSGEPTLTLPVNERSPAGTYPITLGTPGTLSGPSGYTFVTDNSAPGTLTVTKRTLTISAQDVTRQYGEENPSPFPADYLGLRDWDRDPATGAPLAGVLGGVRLYASTSLGGPENVTQQTGVGTYPITWSGNWGGITSQNYAVAAVWPATLTINPAPLTVRADDFVRRIGDPNPIQPSATYTGLMPWDSPTDPNVLVCCSFNGFPAPDAPAGAYSITPGDGWARNYTFTSYLNGTLTVKQPYQLVITADDKTKVYGEGNPPFTWRYVGFEDGDTEAVVSGVRATTTALDRSPLGSYPITLSGAAVPPYYTVSYVPGWLQVTPRVLNLRATDASAQYGALPTFTFTSDLLPGDSLLSAPTLAAGGRTVGAHPIRLTGGAADNYTVVRHDGTLTVTPAPLEVRADDKSRAWGQPPPPFTATVTGLKYDDTASVVQGLNLIADTESGTSQADGSAECPIVQSGPLTAANYSPITFTPGVLTTQPKPLVWLQLDTIATTNANASNANASGWQAPWPVFNPPFGVPAEGADALRYVAWTAIWQLGLNVTDVDAWMGDPANRAVMTAALFEFLKAPLKQGALWNAREVVKDALERQIREMKVKIAEDAVARYNAWKEENRKRYTRLEGLFGILDVPPEDFVASATRDFLQYTPLAAFAGLGAALVAGTVTSLTLPAVLAPFAASWHMGMVSTMAGSAAAGGAITGGILLAVTGTVVRSLQLDGYQKVEDRYANLVNAARGFDIDTALNGDGTAQTDLFGLMLTVATTSYWNK